MINVVFIAGQGIKCDVYRDLSQGRLQREAAVQEGGRRLARHGVHGAQERQGHAGGHPQGHSGARETNGGGWVHLLN